MDINEIIKLLTLLQSVGIKLPEANQVCESAQIPNDKVAIEQLELESPISTNLNVEQLVGVERAEEVQLVAGFQ